MRKVKRLLATCLAAAMLLSLFAGTASAAASWSTSAFTLTDVTAKAGETVSVEFKTDIEIEYFSATNGAFSGKAYSDEACTKEIGGISLTEMTPAAEFVLSSMDENDVDSGIFAYMHANPSGLAKGSAVWTAIYAISDVVTPGEYYVKLDGLSISDLYGNNLSNESFIAKIVVEGDAENPEPVPPVDPEPVPPVDDPTPENCPSAKFTDVDQDLWYHEGIDYAIANSLMNGVADTLFSPNGTTNRAMIVTILHRLEGTPAGAESTFADVPDGQWYADAVGWAAANGIVTGYSEDTFGPLNPITREQMAAILYRYAQYKGYDVSVGESTNILSFGDAETISTYAIPAMQWAVGAELVNGIDGNLKPKGTATRAQVATILMRFCENVAN